MLTLRNLLVLGLLYSFNISYSHGYMLSLSLNELTTVLGGSGKAKQFWNFIRNGDDPLLQSENLSLGWSEKTRIRLQEYLAGRPLLSTTISKETASPCGTRKFLQTLGDGQSVESVLIPAGKYDRTTLCVSTQLGCDRGCAFCLTGTMGLIRNLTSEEIVSQVVRGMSIVRREGMPPLHNVVFMGMGDSGRNMVEVGSAVRALADRDRMSMAAAKLTISTVGPSPEAFMTLADMPGSLAWSLHSADNTIRRKLVPSTRHTVEALRDGFLDALASRPSLRTRTVMVALTLIDGINDSLEDADKLVHFIRPMFTVAPKVMIDLIPYNDISVPTFKRPPVQRVNAFQRHLREQGIYCSVRVTRGDEEYAACGMLATKRIKKTDKTDHTQDLTLSLEEESDSLEITDDIISSIPLI